MNPLFTVMTEFRFDIAHAVADSRVLQGEIGKISDAAEAALQNIKTTGLHLVAQMGLGTGGVLSFLYNAIQSSEKFEQSQRNLSNILLTNAAGLGLSGLTYKQSLMESEKILDVIAKKAHEFGIDPNVLYEQTKALAPVLQGHGLDGADMATSIDLSRSLMKSAPTLGIDPSMVGGQLQDMILGHASGGDRLFQRLVGDTAAFKSRNITQSQQFNALPNKEKITVLTEALGQFANNTNIIAGNMRSLNGQLNIFKSLIYGQFSLLRDIGKELAEPAKQALYTINYYLLTYGKAVSKNIAAFLHQIVSDPIKLFEQIFQFSRLKGDLKKSSGVLSIIGMLEGLYGIHKMMKKTGVDITTSKGFEKGFIAIKTMFDSYSGMIANSAIAVVQKGKSQGWGSVIMSALGGIFSGDTLVMIGTGLRLVLTKVLAPLGLILFFFQAFSRGIAIAKVENLKFLAVHMEQFTRIGTKLMTLFRAIISPFEMALDGWAKMIGWMLSFGFVTELILGPLEKFIDLMMWLAKGLIAILSLLNAGIGMVMNGMRQAITKDWSESSWGDLKKNFIDNFDDVWTTYFPSFLKDDKEGPVSQKITNIDHIEIKNDFKEQLEPDRIAFTLAEQLMKVTQNPGQAAGRSIKGSALGG